MTARRDPPGRRSRRRQDARRRDDLQAVVGVLGLALIGSRIHESDVTARETSIFRAVNDLPDAVYRPSWLLMQAGNALAAPTLALVLLRSGRPRLALRVLASGLLAWASAKAVKRLYRRPRPAEFLADVSFRGRPASGLGYVSGHAAVSTAIALALSSERPRADRTAAAIAVPVVGLSRMYVGAHLPLDVLGGVALGVAVDGCVGHLLDAGNVPGPRGRSSLGALPRWRDARRGGCGRSRTARSFLRCCRREDGAR